MGVIKVLFSVVSGVDVVSMRYRVWSLRALQRKCLPPSLCQGDGSHHALELLPETYSQVALYLFPDTERAYPEAPSGFPRLAATNGRWVSPL